MKKNVLLGMSGGIDSSVCALLLKEQGFTVTGCTLLLKKQSDVCDFDVKAAQSVAEKLCINLIISDYRQHFQTNVEKYFINEYLNGRTPNPCIICNPTTKFFSLLKEADAVGAHFVATGHYANIFFNEENGLYELKKSPSKKDQSYFLYRLTQKELSRVIFPLGGFLTKDEIRARAREHGFINAEKSDSQDICFVPGGDYAAYIRMVCASPPAGGSFTDTNGNVIGSHSGVFNYTVGQRKGLGAFGEPRYVKSINAAKNTVTLCTESERRADTLSADNLSWTSGNAPGKSFYAEVKIRSTAHAVPAEINISGEKMQVKFSEKVLAPCPGQSAVVYMGDTVLGGGIITA